MTVLNQNHIFASRVKKADFTYSLEFITKVSFAFLLSAESMVKSQYGRARLGSTNCRDSEGEEKVGVISM